MIYLLPKSGTAQAYLSRATVNSGTAIPTPTCVVWTCLSSLLPA